MKLRRAMFARTALVADGFYQDRVALVGPFSPPARPSLRGGAVNIYCEAAIWIGMALLAAVVSVRIAVPVALVEIVRFRSQRPPCGWSEIRL